VAFAALPPEPLHRLGDLLILHAELHREIAYQRVLPPGVAEGAPSAQALHAHPSLEALPPPEPHRPDLARATHVGPTARSTAKLRVVAHPDAAALLGR